MKSIVKTFLANAILVGLAYLLQGMAAPNLLAHDTEINMTATVTAGVIFSFVLGYFLGPLLTIITPNIQKYSFSIQGLFWSATIFSTVTYFIVLTHAIYYQRSDLVYHSKHSYPHLKVLNIDKHDFYHIPNAQLSNTVLGQSSHPNKESDNFYFVIPLLNEQQEPSALWCVYRYTDPYTNVAMLEFALPNREVEWFMHVNDNSIHTLHYTEAIVNTGIELRDNFSTRKLLHPVFYNPLEWRGTVLWLASIFVIVVNVFLFVIFREK